MARWDKFRQRLMSWQADANIRFTELRSFLKHLQFEESIEGSHHKFTLADINASLELQPLSDGKTKPYQVRQVRRFFIDHEL